jgi:hypothetical protein
MGFELKDFRTLYHWYSFIHISSLVVMGVTGPHLKRQTEATARCLLSQVGFQNSDISIQPKPEIQQLLQRLRNDSEEICYFRSYEYEPRIADVTKA